MRLSRENESMGELRLIQLKDEFIHVYGAREDVLAAHGIKKQRILDEILGQRN